MRMPVKGDPVETVKMLETDFKGALVTKPSPSYGGIFRFLKGIAYFAAGIGRHLAANFRRQPNAVMGVIGFRSRITGDFIIFTSAYPGIEAKGKSITVEGAFKEGGPAVVHRFITTRKTV